MDDFPPGLLERHPELAEVHKALDAHREGRTTEVRCRKCGGPVTVQDRIELGTLVVSCPMGCTHYRAQSRP